jgi:hypothetical protein
MVLQSSSLVRSEEELNLPKMGVIPYCVVIHRLMNLTNAIQNNLHNAFQTLYHFAV